MFKTQHTKASTLIDVLKQIAGALDAMGVYMPTMIGKAYLSQGAGSAARVVFVPDLGGKIGPPRELGNAASVTHACTAHVRAREGNSGIVSDVERFKEVYDLADIVIDLVQTAGTGRVEWLTYTDGSPVDTDGPFGAEIVLTFSYRRDVAHSVARWSLAPADDDLLGQQPQPPPGELAGGIDIEPETVPVDPNA